MSKQIKIIDVSKTLGNIKTNSLENTSYRSGKEILIAGVNIVYLKLNDIPTDYENEDWDIISETCYDSTGARVAPLITNKTKSSFNVDIDDSGTMTYLTKKL